jgi:hypothetical protein
MRFEILDVDTFIAAPIYGLSWDGFVSALEPVGTAGLVEIQSRLKKVGDLPYGR